MCKAIEIGVKLASIFEERFKVPIDSLTGDWGELPLLGCTFRFAARDLLVLLYLVEGEFGIRVPESALSCGMFSTFNNIIEIIRDAETAANGESVGIRMSAE